ncbi:hypothetical protein [Chelativorans sp. YIM 93263]|uniref:hypothetical protein n=1 Tax=Chelativorans sp. YIM 93263 TaxID=2906648 RepID=UPI0023781AF0|nr:hypothetical protein [Chelativorans sp. YIM 93263]
MKNGNRQGRTLTTRTLMGAAAVLAASVLAGCAGPTYGTGKPAEQLLLEDLTGALSLAPKNKAQIDYEPRPGLVKPPSTNVLPPPQIELATENPQWPESPEQRLARVRAEATANQDNLHYRPNIIHDVNRSSEDNNPGITNPRTRAMQREEVLRRRQMTQQGSPTTRRYLSDPPTEYRQAAESAPAGDPGQDEWKKERARKRQSGERRGIGRLLPW